MGTFGTPNLELEPLPSWYDHAACRGADTNTWFPEQASREGLARAAAAKTLCAICPAVDQCREYAIERPELDGIWGGTTGKQRSAIRVERGITADPHVHRRAYYKPNAERDKAIYQASERGATAPELAAEHGLGIRTIRRILATQRRTERQKKTLPAGADRLNRDAQIHLCHGLGWTDREVAEAVEISERTVSRVLARARQGAAA